MCSTFSLNLRKCERIISVYLRCSVKSCKVKRSILHKGDALTEYQTLFWFAMVISKYEPDFQFRKDSKVAKFEQGLYLGGPPLLLAKPMWSYSNSMHL